MPIIQKAPRSKAAKYAAKKFAVLAALNAEIAAGVPGVAKDKRKLSNTVQKQGVNLGTFWNPTSKNFAR